MFKKINEKFNEAIIAAQTTLATPIVEEKSDSKKTRFRKKIIQTLTTVSVMATLLTTTVSAADGALPGFFSEAVDILGTVIILIGGGLAVWGIVNLLEGYGNDNPGAKSQGMKQLMAGVGVALIGIFAPTALKTLFNDAV